MVDVEICCGDAASVSAAAAGGARRIELCCGLTEGGLTPSRGMLQSALRQEIPEVNVLIRPRRGDFLYSDEEAAVMITDIRDAVETGATGVVIGALDREGNVDMQLCRELIRTAQGRHITFHRAFDMSADYLKALEDIITLGCDSLLTSGMSSTAFEGMPKLKKIVEAGKGRIQIMAGCGVTSDNCREIVESTGVGAVHATARKIIQSKMDFNRDNVNMGSPSEDEFSWPTTDGGEVRRIIKTLLSL